MEGNIIMKTDLEKSHSKWSNFKLTLKSILLVFFFNTLWVLLFFFKELKAKTSSYLPISLICVNILLIFLSMLSFKNFKR